MTHTEAKTLSLFDKLVDHLDSEAADLCMEALEEDGSKDRKRSYRGKIRATIYERDNGLCFHCGEHVEYKKMHVDHVIPHTLGGKTSEENGVVSCRPCNLSKGARVW